MKFLSWIILVVGVLLSFMVAFAEGSSETPFHILGGLLFTLFVISPFIFLMSRLRRVSRRWLPQVILLLGALVITGFGLTIYYESFVVATKRDAQDAVLFFMVPLVQWFGVLLVSGLARLFDRGTGATVET